MYSRGGDHWGGAQEISMESQKWLQKGKIKAKWCAAGMENLAIELRAVSQISTLQKKNIIGGKKKSIGEEKTDEKKKKKSRILDTDF